MGQRHVRELDMLDGLLFRKDPFGPARIAIRPGPENDSGDLEARIPELHYRNEIVRV